jgi:hypothetical protein
MKDDDLYPIYLMYLNRRLMDGKISKSFYSLYKISDEQFQKFKLKLEKDGSIIKGLISEIRDKKIDDIFDDID